MLIKSGRLRLRYIYVKGLGVLCPFRMQEPRAFALVK